MEETKVAIEAAREAGKLLMEKFGSSPESEAGIAAGTVKTRMASEKIILDILRKACPEYPVFSGKAGKGEYMWIIEPLGGATNYSVRNPFFHVSVALAEKNQEWEIVSGVVLAPFTGEVFFAERGEGAFLNAERVFVSREGELKNLLIAHCGSSGKHAQKAGRLFSEIRPLCRDFIGMGAGGLELAFVACGRLGGFVCPGGNAMHAAAGSLLVREAGGKVTDFGGTVPGTGEGSLLATNGLVHEKMMEIVKNLK
jgi:myo-inositol-1(or 4)-monophosphatase